MSWDTVSVVIITDPVTKAQTHILPLSDPAVVAWQAWYADGSSVDSARTTWALAPPAGLCCVLLYLNHTTDVAGREPYRLVSQGAAVVQDDAPLPSVKTGAVVSPTIVDTIVATAFATVLRPTLES